MSTPNKSWLALVPVAVAVEKTTLRPDQVYALADGADLLQPGFLWVWDLSVDRNIKRELLYWLPELEAREMFAKANLETIIELILPKTRTQFHSGELLRMFFISRPTLIKLRSELHGTLTGSRNCFFPRVAVAEFLRRRWLGNLK